MPSSPTPCSEQGHLHLDQVAQSPLEPGLECFQGWGIHRLSGQPGPVSKEKVKQVTLNHSQQNSYYP